MLIYRIEDEDGGGVYRGDNSDMNPMGGSVSDRHPLPADDSLLQESLRFRMRRDLAKEYQWKHWTSFLEDDFIFGFSSIDQMRNWVYQDVWLRKLDKGGFFLSEFNVPKHHVCVGNTQAVFRRSKATKFHRHTMAEFFKL
jgi:hypothetical protein